MSSKNKRSLTALRRPGPLAAMMARAIPQPAPVRSTLDQALLLAERCRLAVDAIARGDVSATEWGTLVDVLGLLEALVELGALDGRSEILRLMEVMTACLRRRSERGTGALYAHELADLRALAATWADVVVEIDLRLLAQAEVMVIERNLRILARLGKGRVQGGAGQVAVLA
jgi:hypothetical protein